MSLKQWKYTNGYEPYETLPSVSSDDNGKVVGVADGAYSLVSGGGGGSNEPLTLNNTYTGEEGYTTIDKTFAEVKSAYLNGTPIILKKATADGYNYYCLVGLLDFGEDGGRLDFWGDIVLDALTQNDYPTNEQE